jgi:SAM-dependent methyltransferase
MMNPAEFANIAAAEQDLWWYRGMRDILFGLLDPIAKQRRFDRILEAGCGTGYLSQVLAARYGWNMVPLDFDAAGLRYAHAAGMKSLVQGDMQALPFASASFDALFSIDVIPHLQPGAEDKVFAEFARVLKPGGTLVLRAAALNALRSRHSQFVHEVQRFTRGGLVRCLTGAGFTIDRATYANSLLLPIAVFKFRVWEPLTRQAPQSGVQHTAPWLDRMLYFPLHLESRWIASGKSLPLGQTAIVLARKSL